MTVLASTQAAFADAVSSVYPSKSKMRETNMSHVGLLIAAVACAVMPLDISQLAFAVAGALAFSVIQSIQAKSKKSMPSSRPTCATACVTGNRVQGCAPVRRFPSGKAVPSIASKPRAAPRPASQPDVRKPSTVPILAPTFESTDWDVQIKELLTQITPSVEDDKIVAKLASRVRQAIRPLIPEVEVVGFASGDLSRNKAFGVAVPEVDIIANVNPSVLAERLGGRMNYTNAMKLDSRKLQKSAIRACCDRLVSVGGFKFRRSAFRGDEPKVTLLVPASFGLSNDSIPIDFSVNAVSPLHNAALLTECGQMEPRARELILLVKRWAKDRGICHAAKGHLSPYSWALLCIFFMQAGGANENGPLLPPVADFKMASGLMGKKKSAESSAWSTPAGATKPIGTLFKEFVHFYCKEFEWRKEAISVRIGKRQTPDLSLSLNILVNGDGTTQVGPSIEDPFDETKNMSSGMNVASLARLHEELARAEQMCSSESSLAALLEPWAPPDYELSEQNSADNSKDQAERSNSPKSEPALPPWRMQMRPSAE
jgi:hypothetical protein